MSKPSDLRWSLPALILILAFQVVWRAHTFGETALYRPLIRMGLAAGGTVEPLDCDEAIYAYMGRRMLAGDLLYRDLSENKPPLGYWLYALTVKIGGANEWAIRLMPYPFVLATTVLVWWIARRLGGPWVGLFAAFLFVLVDTDPYLFGNGANLEHEMNLFATAALATFLLGWNQRGSVAWLLGSGALLGSACLIKQTAIVPIVLFLPALLLIPRATESTDASDTPVPSPRWKRLIAFVLGFGAVWVLALGILAAQGVLRDGFDHFVVWARALARETPPDPGSPPWTIRWLVGNADPKGTLPWPFGNTDYLVWWGTGAWPLWAALVPALALSLLPLKVSAERRLVGIWAAATCVEVVLSGLYWQHYYLLPVPGLAILIALMVGDCVRWSLSRTFPVRLLGVATASLLIAATAWTIRIQIRDYLQVTPSQITSKLKGGAQWVALRQMGLDLQATVRKAQIPQTLHVWGWQSPLYLYGEFDSPTPYAFSDPLLKALSATDHPLIRPRVKRILDDLKAKPPSLLLAADPPFPALRQFLNDEYVVSFGLVPWAPDGRGLWVHKAVYSRFEAARTRPAPSY